jgi:hypothetical protein
MIGVVPTIPSNEPFQLKCVYGKVQDWHLRANEHALKNRERFGWTDDDPTWLVVAVLQ